MQLSNHIKTEAIKVDGTNYTLVAGTTDVTSEVIDTAGFEGVRIVAVMGTITTGAVTSASLVHGATSSPTDAVEGSAQTIADTKSNNCFVWDVYRPTKRYLKFSLDRGTQNAVVLALLVEYYGHHGDVPVTESTRTTVEKYVSPATGTA